MMKSNSPSVQTTLSVDELKALIHEAVRDTLLEIFGEDMNTDLRIGFVNIKTKNQPGFQLMM